MFSKILIANRGEIACRVIDTCRRLNIGTIAVFSEADRSARHVSLADDAVPIGPPAPAESYLAIERIVQAAKAAGAEAIHPGYGFLSENPEFAQACEDAGVTFIGPRAETIRLMGSKRESKELMASRGIPIVPGYHGNDQSIQTLEHSAVETGFPLMIKASAGGGGKGMRIVRDARKFGEALRGAKREAMAAFGDDGMLLEKYLERPRHIEFQIFGDNHGNVLHLNERECSIQRRHQKIIEETPSPFVDNALRQQMAIAAVEAARAVKYVNAGTVEFIVGADHEFYFMEMNTRLQVEHPVTEMVTGLDLVEWQLRVAAGEKLPIAQTAVKPNGHAIEVRVYAEDPYREFVPSTGEVQRFVHPAAQGRVRVDSGIRNGDYVSIHYDPMIAKIVVWGEDRPSAVESLQRTLAETGVFGPITNLPLLRSIVAHSAFSAAQIDTAYIDAHLESLLSEADEVPELALIAATCRVMLDREMASRFDQRLSADDPESPWNIRDGWQLSGRTCNRFVFVSPSGARHEAELAGWDGRYRVTASGATRMVEASESSTEALALSVDGRRVDIPVSRGGGQIMIRLPDHTCLLRERALHAPERHASDEESHPGSPLPGRIVSVEVQEGDRVQAGQALLIIEGMKMEYTLKARAGGTVETIHHRVGDMVDAEVPLIDILPDEPSA